MSRRTRACEKQVSEWSPSSLKNVKDLHEMEFPVRDDIVKNLLPKGLCVFAGPPKTGKSFTVFSLALSIAEGEKFLDTFTCNKGNVLYLALEDNNNRLFDRLISYDSNEELSENLEYDTQWPELGSAECLRRFELWVESRDNPRLIIVDTLARISPTNSRRGNAYEHDTKWSSEYQRFALENNICILFVTHLRKGLPMGLSEDISGSMGLPGVADSIWRLKPDESSSSARLSGSSRELTDFSYSLSRKPNGFWKYNGEAIPEASSPERQEIIEVIRENDGEASPKEIAAILGHSDSSSIRNMLCKMVGCGEVKRIKTGLYAEVMPSEPLGFPVDEASEHSSHQIDRDESFCSPFDDIEDIESPATFNLPMTA
jgi:AAA domain